MPSMTPDRWRQIQDLYRSAQNCPALERAGLLEDADPEVRYRVQQMLAINSGDHLFDRPASDFLDELPDSTLEIGAQLGPYRIENRIGAGGMGEVFKAIDTRLGRAVAIKTIRQVFSARFKGEAQAISALNHPLSARSTT
jgi:serine/threonine protein kinase